MFKTPILLITWRRPQKTLEVIKQVRKIAPKKIYLACDGPIKNDKINQEKVFKTREILHKEINWDCEIKKSYSKVNLGCRLGVSNAISWFFQNEEKGIILEDDCVPHKDFLYFCSIMLDKYQNDSRIWCISANNNQGGQIHGNGSYYFGRYNHCWGWASWRRCWQFYDPYIKNWPKIKKEKVLNNIFAKKHEIQFWEKTFDNIYYRSIPDTWDYQWSYTCFLNSGLTIIPNINLVNNIGYDQEATHTIKGLSFTNNKELNFEESGIFPIKDPQQIIRSKSADEKIECLIYSGYPIFSFQSLKNNFKKLILKLNFFLKLRKYLGNKTQKMKTKKRSSFLEKINSKIHL